jgi:hypothetical protein
MNTRSIAAPARSADDGRTYEKGPDTVEASNSRKMEKAQ